MDSENIMVISGFFLFGAEEKAMTPHRSGKKSVRAHCRSRTHRYLAAPVLEDKACHKLVRLKET